MSPVSIVKYTVSVKNHNRIFVFIFRNIAIGGFLAIR